jgi:hypothetical protein
MSVNKDTRISCFSHDFWFIFSIYKCPPRSTDDFPLGNEWVLFFYMQQKSVLAYGFNWIRIQRNSIFWVSFVGIVTEYVSICVLMFSNSVLVCFIKFLVCVNNCKVFVICVKFSRAESYVILWILTYSVWH